MIFLFIPKKSCTRITWGKPFVMKTFCAEKFLFDPQDFPEEIQKLFLILSSSKDPNTRSVIIMVTCKRKTDRLVIRTVKQITRKGLKEVNCIKGCACRCAYKKLFFPKLVISTTDQFKMCSKPSFKRKFKFFLVFRRFIRELSDLSCELCQKWIITAMCRVTHANCLKIVHFLLYFVSKGFWHKFYIVILFFKLTRLKRNRHLMQLTNTILIFSKV